MRKAKQATLLSACLILGCAAPSQDAKLHSAPVLVIATTADPDALFPPVALNSQSSQITELIYEYLADVGPSMNTIGDAGFTKELATGWTWSSDSLSIAFHLDPKARWHDGPPVTARDVAFTYSVYTDTLVGSSEAAELEEIDSVTVRDASTPVFWFHRRTPHEFFDAAAKMLILPEHLLGAIPRRSLKSRTAAATPIGSGRYRFSQWRHGSSVELAADSTNYRGAPQIRRVIWTITPEYNSALTKLLGGEADVFDALRPEAVAQLAARKDIRLITLPGMDYAFMAFNLRDPMHNKSPHSIFRSRELRRALTMALDRPSMVRNLFDTLGSVGIGPVVRAQPTTDTSLIQIPYNVAAATRTLDSLGWTRGPDGVRVKNAIRLSFTLLVPVSSETRVRIAVLIQEQLRKIGVEAKIEQMDYAAFSERQQSRKFDCLLAAWHLGSSFGSIRDTWSTNASKPGRGMNYGGYSNPEFDMLVDSALSSRTMPAARAYLRRANQIIIDDAPAIWLYEPRTVIGIRTGIETTPMRPNAWWLDIGSWTRR